jgi:hypothetical protein
MVIVIDRSDEESRKIADERRLVDIVKSMSQEEYRVNDDLSPFCVGVHRTNLEGNSKQILGVYPDKRRIEVYSIENLKFACDLAKILEKEFPGREYTVKKEYDKI